MQFPDGKRFAFSILDDTDDATLANVRPVYEALRAHGFRTTKTVWAVDCPEGSPLFFAAETLQDGAYLEFVRELARDGFEIAFHGASMESSPRERTLAALELLKREIGAYPVLHCNHGYNRDSLYWGAERFRTPWLRWIARHAFGASWSGYEGAVEGSPYFWGDLCLQHFRYVRNFTFAELDALSVNREMPYRLESTPWVPLWFSTADAADAEEFKRRLTRQALARLEAEGGVCIVSTHLGKGFAREGRIDPEIDALLGHLATRPGWFVPVSTILDHLRAGRSERTLGGLGLLRLELRFLRDRLRSQLAERRARARARPARGR